MNNKYYISTREDKVGTVFAVAKYEDDEYRQVYINKVASNGMDALKDIVDWLIEKDTNNDTKMMSFKFKNVDIAAQIGNMLDKTEEYKKLKEKNHCIYFSSPAVFSKDLTKMHKAEASLGSYLILREHYIREGKL